MRFIGRTQIRSIGVLVSLMMWSTAFAGTTGNIKGKVTDIEDGKPLPLVNILIVGSGRGGVSGDNGDFFISVVPAGTYTLRVTLLGYKTLEVKNVRIDADETSVQNFELASTLIEKEGLTVEGTRPMVDVKKTAGEQTYNREKIEQLPNVKGVGDVLALQAGVVKFGNQLFLRGGRPNETQIIVDGVVVSDNTGSALLSGNPNEQLQQLYSGTASGSALSVPANAIQSVSVSSSGLDAEYGNAQSGVVNITTRSGGENYAASAQYRNDGATNNTFGERYYAATLSGPEPITHSLLPMLGAEIPGKLAFAISTNFSQLDGPYSYTTTDFYHPVDRKIKIGGIFGNLFGNSGLSYSDKQTNEFSFDIKMSYNLAETDQFNYTYRASGGSYHPLIGYFSWLDRYDSSLSRTSLTTQNVLQWQHVIGTNSILKAYVSRLEISQLYDVAGLPPYEYSSITSTSQSGTDPNYDGFNDIGSSQSWSHSNTVTWNAKVDYSTKLGDLHFVKGGGEYYYQDYQSTSIRFPLAANRDVDSIPRGEYPGYGLVRWVSNNLPSRGAFFAQDNIEMSSLTIKVGLRYDWQYLGKQINDPAFVKRYEAATNDQDPQTPYRYADWVDYDATHTTFKARSFLKQFSSGYVSPRLAIGYPISTRTVFYFNYGHFLQFPELTQYYHDPIKTTLSSSIVDNTVGNPSLKPQKTVQYEAGFDQLVFDDLSLGLRGFYKDVFDYVTGVDLKVSGYNVSKYVNLDYASTRGFEVIISKALRNNYFGGLNYTYSLAKGRSSNSLASIIYPELQTLPREVRMDYDVQHRLSLYAGFTVGPQDEFNVFGLNINDWSASATWSFESGAPYTPYNPNGSTTLSALYLKNSATGPLSSEVDIALSKGFVIFDKMNLAVTLDVKNLFNRRNVDLSAGAGFNDATGAVTRYGDNDPSPANKYPVYPWSSEYGSQSFAARVPPFVFKPPRQLLLGLKVNWN